MKLFFEVEIDMPKPTWHSHPDPDAQIEHIAKAIERGFAQVRVTVLTPPGWSKQESPLPTVRTQTLYPAARLIGVEP